ncbi:MAG: type II toxin-antitoxin system VapB family antitoxin [Chlorobi bacterium]|nr:type II toxin-antitoxin system VapB family antitoxin [Chlorobiota bacterium]
MRINIVIDDELMNKAILLSGGKTKKAIVEEALQLLVRFKKQLQIREFRGKLNWKGNLEQMRIDK